MGNKVTLGVAALVFAGLAFVAFKPTVCPNVTMVGEDGAATLSQVRGPKPKLVLALVHPSDPNSTTALATLKAQFATGQDRATFAALVFADPAAAAAFAKQEELPFAAYSLTPQQNAAEYNDLVKAVGGFRNRFFVGTVIVLDPSLRISAQVNGNELEGLSGALAKL